MDDGAASEGAVSRREQRARSLISDPTVFAKRVATVRAGRAREHYTPEEAERYTTQTTQTKEALPVSALTPEREVYTPSLQTWNGQWS